MENLLQELGINTKKLYSKPLHDSKETQTIFGCSHRTLKNWERKGILNRNRFKNRVYYTTKSIESCAKEQLGLNTFENMWNYVH